MAEGLVTIAAEGILKKMLSIAAGELAIAWGYEEKLISLHRTLDLIRAKLLDAEGKKETRAVMVWLKQLKDVVGEADDVLDEVHYEMLRRQINKEDQVERKVPCLPSLKRFSFRNEFGHKIENINKNLLDIDTRANSLGLQGEHSAAPVPDRLYWRESVPHPEEFKIVGRVDDEERIIHRLTESRKEEKLTIVPITGMGGMGKTTLAKSVYNNPKIQQRFDVKAWLCVSVKVDINTLLAKIYESFSGRKSMSDLKVNLIKSLEEELATKRYFLVLDDVWVEERQYWEDFRSCMIKVNSRNGSGIIVTTRKLDIGTTGMKADSCLLKGLSDDHCWDIFRERAFVAGTIPSRELDEIGREIVNKCGGLPLLLNLIGGMLANYNDKEKWLAIRNSKVWDLEDETERVQKSLELSFDNLPNSMAKQCFAYCSIFKKDKVMKREELVLFWMALGLVQAHDERNKEMEDVANDIFQILVSNSLFQDVERDEYGHITRCSMHDLVHDLSLSLSKHESLHLMMDATNDDIACIPQVRHLAFYQEKNEDDEFEGKVSLEFIERNLVARNLHTLFIKGGVENKFPFQRLKCVRILKLKGCRIWMIDDSIGELVHLRYLDLSNTKIHVLPKSVGKLYHLQTLKLLDCLHLEFPEEMRNLISLRHYESHQSLPANFVGHLTSLRTLMPYFRVLRNVGHGIEELSRLKHLRGKLCIFNLENVRSKKDAVKADLCSKKSLYEIEFSWSENHESASRNDREVLEGLQLPGDVNILQIQNFSSDSFPEWVMKMGINIDGKWMLLNKLVQIKLIGCRSCLSLPMLEHIPHLRDLVLEDMDSLTCLKNSNVTGSTKPLSPSLRSLRLERMKKLEKWIDGAPNSSKMISPVLQILNINGCPKITLIDECHPHPLVSLKIRDCTGLVSIKSIHGLTSLESLSIEKCPNLLGIAPFFGDNYPTSVTKMAMDIEGKWIPFDKLMSITLIGCRSCLSLPTLEHLPHLRDLELWFMDKLTCLRSSDVTGSTKPLSPSLRSLQLRGMKRLEKWIDGAPNSSIMISPVLERLYIDFCPEIIVLDECHPHPLVSLKISHCTGLVSIKHIQGLTSLVSLSIDNCPSLLDIDNLSDQCHSLKTVNIDACHKLQTSLPGEMFDSFNSSSNSSFSLPMEIIEELPLLETELDSSSSLQEIEELTLH